MRKTDEASARGGRDRERGLSISSNPYNGAAERGEWAAWRMGWFRTDDTSARLAALFQGWSK